MLPSEMIILMAIAISKNYSKNLLRRPMDVTGEYIGYLYNSLVKRGYLKRHGSTSYQLTPIGREAVFEFLNRNKTKANEVAIRLQLLGIEISPEQEQKTGKLTTEASKLK